MKNELNNTHIPCDDPRCNEDLFVDTNGGRADRISHHMLIDQRFSIELELRGHHSHQTSLNVMNTTRLHCSEQKAFQQFAGESVEELVDFVHVGRGSRRGATSIYTIPSHGQSPRVWIQRSITKYISTLLRSKKFLSTKNTPMRMTQPATHRPHRITDKHMINCHMCNFHTMQVINIPGCQLSLL